MTATAATRRDMIFAADKLAEMAARMCDRPDDYPDRVAFADEIEAIAVKMVAAAWKMGDPDIVVRTGRAMASVREVADALRSDATA